MHLTCSEATSQRACLELLPLNVAQALGPVQQAGQHLAGAGKCELAALRGHKPTACASSGQPLRGMG